MGSRHRSSPDSVQALVLSGSGASNALGHTPGSAWCRTSATAPPVRRSATSKGSEPTGPPSSSTSSSMTGRSPTSDSAGEGPPHRPRTPCGARPAGRLSEVAAARLIGIPLVAHDGISFDTPGLEVISELGPLAATDGDESGRSEEDNYADPRRSSPASTPEGAHETRGERRTRSGSDRRR